MGGGRNKTFRTLGRNSNGHCRFQFPNRDSKDIQKNVEAPLGISATCQMNRNLPFYSKTSDGGVRKTVLGAVHPLSTPSTSFKGHNR